MNRKVKLTCAVAAALAAVALAAPANATPLDKLIGKSLTVGNLMFSNFAAPSFVGAGPSAIDVQGVVLTDPITGAVQTGLRFVAPFAQTPKSGPHEIVLNVDYSVTDLTGRVRSTSQTINASTSGQGQVYFFTQASPNPGFAADGSLSVMSMCIPAAPAVGACSDAPASADVFAAGPTFHVENQVQLLISNRRGGTGTTNLQEFEILFAE